MEGPGLGFQGAGGQPGSAPCSCVTWQTGEQVSPEGVSATSFSVFPTHSEGWGTRFLAAVAGLKGNLRGERRGRFFKGLIARGFSAGLLYEERAA